MTWLDIRVKVIGGTRTTLSGAQYPPTPLEVGYCSFLSDAMDENNQWNRVEEEGQEEEQEHPVQYDVT